MRHAFLIFLLVGLQANYAVADIPIFGGPTDAECSPCGSDLPGTPNPCTTGGDRCLPRQIGDPRPGRYVCRPSTPRPDPRVPPLVEVEPTSVFPIAPVAPSPSGSFFPTATPPNPLGSGGLPIPGCTRDADCQFPNQCMAGMCRPPATAPPPRP